MVKKILYKLLPSQTYSVLEKKWRDYKARNRINNAYKNDLNRYRVHTDFLKSDTAQKLIGKIIKKYHVLEKGITMPDMRLGFGKAVLVELAKSCVLFSQKYGLDEPQLSHAISVILEYEQLHETYGFLLDSTAIAAIKSVKEIDMKVGSSTQRDLDIQTYFKDIKSEFSVFARSRASVRNYSDVEISQSEIDQALDLAKLAPSACNRQCWRTYVYHDKAHISKILTEQGGNRGFGHLANKLIVVVAEVGVFSGVSERNQAFIDGGIYAMNLLYGLHYNKIAACILNCSFDIDKEGRLRELCGIKETEVFIAMISCGKPAEKFKVPISARYDIGVTNSVIYK